MIDELAEHQRLVPVLQQFVQDVLEHGQLGAARSGVRQHQAGMAASPAQLHDLGQNLQRFLALVPVQFGQPGQRLLAQGFVQSHFLRAQLHPPQDLGARRQRLQHLRFQPAQDEGLDQFSEPVPRPRVLVPLDGGRETLVKICLLYTSRCV